MTDPTVPAGGTGKTVRYVFLTDARPPYRLEAVLDRLAKIYRAAGSEAVYVRAVAMIAALAGGRDTRPAGQRMADVTTVCAAVRRFEAELSADEHGTPL